MLTFFWLEIFKDDEGMAQMLFIFKFFSFFSYQILTTFSGPKSQNTEFTTETAYYAGKRTIVS